MSAQVETIWVIQYTEKQRLTPCDLLVAYTKPERPGVVIKIERWQVDHIVLTTHLKPGRTIPPERGFEVVRLTGSAIVDIPSVESAHFCDVLKIAIECGINIELRSSEHHVPIIALCKRIGPGDGAGSQAQELLHSVRRFHAVIDIPRLVPGVLIATVNAVSPLLSDKARDVPIDGEG